LRHSELEPTEHMTDYQRLQEIIVISQPHSDASEA